MLDPRYSSLLYSSPQNYPHTREFQMIDCGRNSRSVKNQVFELDIYTHVHRLEATKKYVPRSINSFQPEVSVSIRWKELCVIHLRSRQLASIVEWRKDVSVGQKDWHRGIKLLCVTAEREYSIIIHVFSRSPLWIHTARDFIARRSSLNDELPIERHLWAKKKKKNQSLSRKGYAILFIKMRFFYKLWRKFKRISSNI